MRRWRIRGADVVFTTKELLIVIVGPVILGNIMPAAVWLLIILQVGLLVLMTPVK
jgi:hypothetical protein